MPKTSDLRRCNVCKDNIPDDEVSLYEKMTYPTIGNGGSKTVVCCFACQMESADVKNMEKWDSLKRATDPKGESDE